MPVPVSELQGINPTAIVDLFQLHLDSTLHGSSDIHYFHNGTSTNDAADILFGGQAYIRLPIQAEGFEYKAGQSGALPRPTLRVSNLFGTITSILNEVNETTAGNDLTGAKVIRIRTLERFIDTVNFGTDGFLSAEDTIEDGIVGEDGSTLRMENTINPHGTPDSSYELPQEIYFVDRKSAENREVCEFELASALDLAGVRLPKRQCLPADFPGIGTFHNG